MTRSQVVRDMRATLDRQNPGWRDALREQMDAEKPGWQAAVVKVIDSEGDILEVALMATPERVPDAAEIDPENDPFLGW